MSAKTIMTKSSAIWLRYAGSSAGKTSRSAAPAKTTSARMGQAIRATAQNARAARVMGIDTDRVYAWTFGLNAAICGASGALVAMTWVVQPYLGLPYTLRAFMIVILAGLGNVTAVLAAALGLGVAENVAGFVLGAEYQAAFVFGLLVVILVWRRFWLARERRYLQ